VEKQITRTADESWMTKELFLLTPEQWTPVHIAEDGSIAFTYLKSRQISTEPVLDKLHLGKEKIGADIQRQLAEKIFARQKEKRAVIIPIQTE
jgi:hypothetical protein